VLIYERKGKNITDEWRTYQLTGSLLRWCKANFKGWNQRQEI